MTYRTRRTHSSPASGWGQVPAWGLPVDDPLPLRAAGSVGRWLWPTLAVAGFLLVAGFVFRHDDPASGLSQRGLLTIALAAAVVVVLTIRRAAGPGPLTRAVAEYAVVFLLAVLVATTGVTLDQPPAASEEAGAVPDQRPALVKTIDGFRDWLGEWREWARKEANRRTQPSSTATQPEGEAMAPFRVPPPSTRRLP